MPIEAGDSVPSVELMEGTPSSKVNTNSFPGKTVLFGVPGAFTPGCTKTHAPGYVDSFDAFKAKGVEMIYCVSVNDPFVMAAWGSYLEGEGKVRFLADLHGEFAKALDLELDCTPFLGNTRCKRFAMYIEDGKVKALSVEPDGTGLTCSLAENFIKTF